MIGKGVSNPSHQKIVQVLWDMGTMADYRAGYDNKYDLLIYDNAPTGVKHHGVVCDECKTADIGGIRWKCSQCYDYDLCFKCYMSGKHDLKHTFLRIAAPGVVGKAMPARVSAGKVQAKGLFMGAKVVRGRDWQWKDQDGGSGSMGQVLRLGDWANTCRSAVAVRWDRGGSYEYRLGHDGKADVKCIKPTGGGHYYKDHLPKFGDVDVLEVGDRVAVKLDQDILKPLQEDHGGWNKSMEKYIGQTGRLTRILPTGDVRIQYPDGKTWVFNNVAVTKLESFKPGDKVRVTSDLAKAKDLQKEHGGWNSLMEKSLGKEGRVLIVDGDGDVKVNVGGNFWTYNPEALTLLEQGTGAEGLFEQERDDLFVHMMKQLFSPLGLDSSDIRQAIAEAHADTPDPKEFLKAVLEGEVKKVSEALARKKDLVHISAEGITPLHIASFQGHLPVVQLLIKHGAKIDVKDNEGDTPLANACYQNKVQVVKFLLDCKADPNTTNKGGGRTPLHVATSKNHVDCVLTLLHKGSCNPNIQDSVGDTALHDAIRKSQNDITDLLIGAKNIDLKIKNKRGFNPLHHATLTDNAHATRQLLKKQRSLVDIRKDDGYSALHLAVHNNHRNIVQILITEGKCAIDLYNEQHQSPLILAIARGLTPIIEDLVEHGADVNSKDGDGDSCLHIAVMRHRQGLDVPDSDILKKFRKKYRDSGITSRSTALMCFLVQEGADVNHTNLKKNTALSYLKEASVRRVLEHVARKREREETGDSSFVKVGGDGDAAPRQRHASVLSACSTSSDKSDDATDGSPRDSLSDDSFCGIHIIKEPDKEVKLGEFIGKGGFGEVRKGQWRGTPVAVKLLKSAGSREEEVNKEVSIHKRALHPNIVQLMAVGHKPDESLIVMQFIDGSNLSDIIFKDGNKLTFPVKLRVSRDILSAVTYLHHCKILHLDIKPQNVILEKMVMKPYLCDLGLAHIKTRCSMSQSTHVMARGTIRYMPPEAMEVDEKGEMRATSASDVWSLACTFVELFTGETVWPPLINQMALAVKLMGADVTPTGVIKLDAKLKDILKPCFVKGGNNRPTAEKLMQEFSGLV